MEIQKLDTKRTYGTVFGHEAALYEQDGKLFGGDHKVLGQEESDPVQEQIEAQKTKPNGPEEFLRTMLQGTSIAKTNVYKEAQVQKQNWDKVLKAVEKIGVQTFMLKGVEMWKLTGD
jgi:hypothetical protein